MGDLPATAFQPWEQPEPEWHCLICGKVVTYALKQGEIEICSEKCFKEFMKKETEGI